MYIEEGIVFAVITPPLCAGCGVKPFLEQPCCKRRGPNSSVLLHEIYYNIWSLPVSVKASQVGILQKKLDAWNSQFVFLRTLFTLWTMVEGCVLAVTCRVDLHIYSIGLRPQLYSIPDSCSAHCTHQHCSVDILRSKINRCCTIFAV